MEEGIEITPLQLEQKRIEGELRFQEQELVLRREESQAKIKEIEHKKNSIYFSITATIGVALFGLLGTWLGAYMQERSNIKLEEKKLQSSLFMKAIETNDTTTARNNLIFLLNARIILDPDSSIRRALKGNIPMRSFFGLIRSGEPPTFSLGEAPSSDEWTIIVGVFFNKDVAECVSSKLRAQRVHNSVWKYEDKWVVSVGRYFTAKQAQDKLEAVRARGWPASYVWSANSKTNLYP